MGTVGALHRGQGATGPYGGPIEALQVGHMDPIGELGVHRGSAGGPLEPYRGSWVSIRTL